MVMLGVVEQINCLQRHRNLVAKTTAVADADFKFAEATVSIMACTGQQGILLVDEIVFHIPEHHFFQPVIIAKSGVGVRSRQHTPRSRKTLHSIGVQNIL